LDDCHVRVNRLQDIYKQFEKLKTYYKITNNCISNKILFDYKTFHIKNSEKKEELYLRYIKQC